ncbi:hypothetical protein [Ohessyouella blattaphilus]|uniref:Uncharacterized protein n=1 Tax=Ohessyouella blattaphilus TaxID=2949333 RepID=A0ABT1EIX5_9FIRM|nr:hypothetical protein [Ohessyouella blattaphilus]MCP1109262.1 hypothetical protein [Ohessyouella blattaphilus]MCR8562656.1 hypothetical protein [Ohessyouella blattaphilus]
MKLIKGTHEYLKRKKRLYLLLTILEFGVVIGLVVTGIIATGDRLNVLTVVAAVGCLPAAKMLVQFIVMIPHRSLETEKVAELESEANYITKIYDLVITSKDRTMPIQVLCLYNNTICGYSESEKLDPDKTAQYLKGFLEKNGYPKMTVKIFKDFKAFLMRAEVMNNIATVEKKDSSRYENKLKALLLSQSL